MAKTKNTRLNNQPRGSSAQKNHSMRPDIKKISALNETEKPVSMAWIDRFESTLSIRYSPFLVATLINAILFGIIYSFFKPEFNTGDDRAMMLLSAGKLIALEPTEYLIFTNIIVGHLLKALYVTFPAVSWYPIYLIGGLFCGYTALLYSIVKRRPSIISLLIYCSSFTVIGGYMLLELQFTMTATIVGFGGFALLFVPESYSDRAASLWHHISAKLRSGAGIVGVFLILLSAMIRWQSFLLVMVCTVPIVLVGLLFVVSRRQSFVTMVLLVLACSFAGGSEMYHRHRYEHWGTFNYLEFNRLYGEFSDFRRSQRIPVSSEEIEKLTLTSTGWSSNDYEMFMNEFYMDEKLYTIEKMRSLLDGIDRFENEISKNTLNSSTSSNFEVRKSYYEKMNTDFWKRQQALMRSDALLCAILFLLAGVLLSEFEIYSVVIIVAVMGAVVGVLAYVNYQTLLRDPAERVFYPLWVYVSLLALLCTTARKPRLSVRRNAVVQNVLTVVALLACSFTVWYGTQTITTYYSGITEEIRGGEERLRKAVAALHPTKENLYVIWAYGFPFRDIPPFCDVTVFNNFRALWLMWAQRTPTTKQVLDSYGIRNIYEAIPRQQNIFFLFSVNQVTNPLLNYHLRFSAYVDEHSHTRINIRPNSERCITNTTEGKNGNPYTTFLTLGLDTLSTQDVLLLQKYEQSQQTNQEPAKK
jgi:hypothetical protein